MSGAQSGEQTFDPKALGLRDAGQKPVDVDVKSFSEIEADAAKYGVTRAHLEAAITKPTPSMQETYAFVVTRALMAKKEAVTMKDENLGYPIEDNSEKPKEEPLIYTRLNREGSSYSSVTMTRKVGDAMTYYTIKRDIDPRGNPTYSAQYDGPKKAALPNTDGNNPFGDGVFNPKMKHENLSPNGIQWVFSRLGGFPPGFMAPPAEAPRTLAEAAAK